MHRNHVRFTLILVVAMLPSAASWAADVPPRAESGQVLVVPTDQLDAGEVYHVTPATGTQLVWTADAPLLRIVATSDRVVGYLLAPFDLEEGKSPLLAGAWRVPLASLTTGNQAYDEQLHGATGMNVAEHPEMTFVLTDVSNVEQVGAEGGRASYKLDIAGEMTLRGQTVALEFPARMVLVPFTWGTMRFNLGDFVVLRAAFDVKLGQFGIDPPPGTNADLRPDVVRLDWYLLCSTVSPERNIDPNTKHEHYRKQLRFLTLLRDFDDAEKAYKFGRVFMREIWDEAPALNSLAWATLTEPGVKTRDFAFAIKAAQHANELTEFKNPQMLHTLARAHFDKGELDSALKWIREAAQHLGGASDEAAASVRSDLDRYERHAASTP